LAVEGVARKVATPVPRPETPVEIGRPVAFVRVAEDGVPSAGVTRVGEVAKTSEPEPVSSVTAVIRLALEGVARAVATPVPRPEIPVDTGSPVPFVRTTAEGVPRAGVTRVAEVARTTSPVPVEARPPKEPALLYWIWPLEPPGVPSPPPPPLPPVVMTM
jgi:hypothetical protein